MKVAVGHSDDVDSHDAIQDVLNQCRDRLGASTPQAGIIYMAIHHDFQAILDAVMDRHPGIELIGCTTDGELSSIEGFAEDSVTLVLISADQVRMRAGVGTGIRENPTAATRQAVESARSELDDGIKLCIALPESLGVDVKAAAAGLAAALGAGVPVCGGMSGDQQTYSGPRQFYGNQVLEDSIVILLFSGSLNVSYAVASGWQPIGAEYTVTEAEGAVVSQIGNMPAAELYERHVGRVAPDYPLAVYVGDSHEHFLSSPLKAEPDGGVFFFNPIEVGARVQLSDASRSDVIEAARTVGQRAIDGYPWGQPDAALLFSCAGRRVTLGTRVREETEQFRSFIGADIPVCGFYCYGEICPLPGSSEPYIHNSTLVAVLIGES